MQYNFVILRTDKGRRYANKILRSVKWLNENRYSQHEFNIVDLTISHFIESYEDGMFFDTPNNKYQPRNTIIHPRCAHPTDTTWIKYLKALEQRGYKIVNSVDTIKLTSNKLACSLHLQDKVSHPKSWEYKRSMSDEQFIRLLGEIDRELSRPELIIAKPLTSIEQGANVKKIPIRGDGYIDLMREQFNQVPGNKIVVQEYVPYTALHRVIVIGGKALPYTFIDKPEWHTNGDWKVSCCLNRTTMKLNENADRELLELAEKTQKEVGGVINFIDIFEYEDWSDTQLSTIITKYTNAEINTACSLNIHERLAKQAGRLDWNIHSRIGRELIKQLGIR